MKSSELDYELPRELIAQRPLERRDASRLLVYDRASGVVRHGRVDELPEEVPESALTVVNDTRVLPARLRLERPGGGKAEVLLLERLGANGLWEGLARPTRRLRPGQRLGPVELVEHLGEGRWRLRLEGEPAGEAPLPPYITEPLADSERYQTVYAAEEGSAAAPTAGLHFTPELLSRLDVERVTLHVGLDTSCTASGTRSPRRRGSGSGRPSGFWRWARRPCVCSRHWRGAGRWPAARTYSSRPASSSGAWTRC